MSDSKNPGEGDVPPANSAYVAPNQPGKPTMAPSTGGGQGLRLGILAGLFALAAFGILGYRAYLDSQIPKPDPNVKRPAVDADTDMGSGSNTGMPMAPGA